jgi:chromosome segregation ATPase
MELEAKQQTLAATEGEIRQLETRLINHENQQQSALRTLTERKEFLGELCDTLKEELEAQTRECHDAESDVLELQRQRDDLLKLLNRPLPPRTLQ